MWTLKLDNSEMLMGEEGITTVSERRGGTRGEVVTNGDRYQASSSFDDTAEVSEIIFPQVSNRKSSVYFSNHATSEFAYWSISRYSVRKCHVWLMVWKYTRCRSKTFQRPTSLGIAYKVHNKD